MSTAYTIATATILARVLLGDRARFLATQSVLSGGQHKDVR